MTNIAYGIAAFFVVVLGAPLVVYAMSLYLGLLFGGVYFWTSLWMIVIGLAVGSMVTEIRGLSKKAKSNG